MSGHPLPGHRWSHTTRNFSDPAIEEQEGLLRNAAAELLDAAHCVLADALDMGSEHLVDNEFIEALQKAVTKATGGQRSNMSEWKKVRKTAIAYYREARPEDEEMIRRREGEALASLGIDESEPVWPHYLVMRGGEGEEYPISREVFSKTYESIEEN